MANANGVLKNFANNSKNFDMRAPNKIYASIVDNRLDASFLEKSVSGKKYPEFVRKEALLEWAKAKKAELLNEELTDVAAGINMGMDMLIYKLEQL